MPFPPSSTQHPPHQHDNRTATTITQLGYAGLVPFGFGALCIWLSPWLIERYQGVTIAQGTLVYAGIIASYMAGMGAGTHLSKDHSGIGTYLPGMIATLFAWLMIVPEGYVFFTLPLVWRFLGLALVFGWLYMRDQGMAARKNWPGWYAHLRLRLTAWVVLGLTAIASRLALWYMY